MARRKSAKNEVQDPSLPLKKRARWRLIGACVLAMGAMIILPFALESEPRRELGDVEVHMPPRTEIGKMDRVLPTGRPPAQQPAGGVGAGAGAAIGATAAAAGVAAKRAAADAADSTSERIRTTLPTALPNGLAGAKPERIGANGRPVTDKPGPAANAAPGVVRRGEAALPKIQPAVSQSSAKNKVKTPEKAPAVSAASSGKEKVASSATGVKGKPAGSKPAGKAPVKVAKATPAKPPKTTKPSAPPIPKRRTNPNSLKAASPSGYVVQIGAFSSMRSARAQVARGSKLGFKPYTEKVTTSRGDRIRVRVGPYLTKKQAVQARAKLRAAGIDTALIAP